MSKGSSQLLLEQQEQQQSSCTNDVIVQHLLQIVSTQKQLFHHQEQFAVSATVPASPVATKYKSAGRNQVAKVMHHPRSKQNLTNYLCNHSPGRYWALLGALMIYATISTSLSLSIFGPSQKDTSLPPNLSPTDYCLMDNKNVSNICMHHDICYNIPTMEWETYSPKSQSGTGPLLNNLGLDNRKLLSDKDPHHHFSQCNERFVPVKKVRGVGHARNEILFVDGTTYYVCIWYEHFGHILMNMLLPSFNALSKIGLRDELGSIKFLLDQRGPNLGNTSLSVFDFVTAGYPGGVTSLSALTDSARREGKERLCFEKFSVGMLHDSLIGVGIGETFTTTHAEVGMIQPLKDHLARKYPANKTELAIASKESLDTSFSYVQPYDRPDCMITLLDRKTKDRGIVNKDKVIGVIKEVFDPNLWSFRTVFFDNASIKSQYLTMQSTSLFLSVTGTGSHMAMFLRDGAASLEMTYFERAHNNHALCSVIPSLLCYISPPESNHSTYEEGKLNPVKVDLMQLKDALTAVHEQLLGRCLDSS